MRLLRITRRLAPGGAVSAAVLAVTMIAVPAQADEGVVLGVGHDDAIAGSYVVVLNDSTLSAQAVQTDAGRLAARYGGRVAATYAAALRGFSARMDERAARRLAADPAVDFVQQDIMVHLADTQTNPPSWGLDRVDQRGLPLNNSYTYPTTAPTVHVYVIDTGVLISHQDFGGRASHGRDTVDDDNDSTDCNGHGTHVAGTVAGSAHGIAKRAFVHGVRVVGCGGSGSTADIVQGIDWVTANAVRPAVANMSLGGIGNPALDTAVANSISQGITYAVAAANSGADACLFSPALTPTAITVGATGRDDARASFSNFGTCVDLFAPGVGITSAWLTSNTATNTLTGTSMASPHAAGVAALILAANPSFTPQQVRDRMVADATAGAVGNPGTGSPNRLLFVNNGTTPTPETRHEAENAQFSRGLVESNHAGFSGTGFVNYDNVAGSFVQWTVSSAAAGSARLTVRFANGTTTNRPMNISVNGGPPVLVNFPGTGAWASWANATITVNLNAGGNTIRATATTAPGGPNVDYLEVAR